MDADVETQLKELRGLLTDHRALVAKVLIRYRAELEATIDSEHDQSEARYSKAISASEKASIWAQKVDRDQVITHYRLDDLEKRLKALEIRGRS